MAVLRCVLFLLFGVAAVKAYSAGAPREACSTMVPNHAPNPTNIPGGAAPYALIVPDRVQGGQQITVSIGGGKFLGFFLRALDPAGNSGGHFLSGQNYQTIECQTPNDSATHKGPTSYTEVDVKWQAPSQPGTYRIMATVVEDYSKFFTGYFKDIEVQ